MLVLLALLAANAGDCVVTTDGTRICADGVHPAHHDVAPPLTPAPTTSKPKVAPKPKRPRRPGWAGDVPPEDIEVAPSSWPETASVHPAVLAMSDADQQSIESVADAIREHTSPGKDRIRAIHDWIATHIAYDVASLHGPRLSQEPEAVFRRRTGVCEGTARLFARLGDLTGEDVAYVVGWAFSGLHAWNAVKLDDGWALVDATWDAGYVRDHESKFVPSFKTTFLFAPPTFFATGHAPLAPRWELFDRPVPTDELRKGPRIDPSFARLRLMITDPEHFPADVGPLFDVRVDNPDDVPLLGNVCDGGVCEPCATSVDRQKLSCRAAGSGVLDVTISVQEDGNWQRGARFQVRR